MTTFFPNLQLRAVLLQHLRESFGFGQEEFDSESKGVPSAYAVALFDGSKLDPILLLQKFIVPKFAEFAKAALTEIDGFNHSRQAAVLKRLDRPVSSFSVTVSECFADFCHAREVFRDREAISTHLAERAGAGYRYSEIVSRYSDAFEDYEQVFTNFKFSGEKESLEYEYETKMMKALYSLSHGLAVCSVLPSGGTGDPYLAKNFDELLDFYGNALTKFGRFQQVESSPTGYRGPVGFYS